MSVKHDLEAERRIVKRSRLLKGGIIAFSARHATIPCVLRDLSDTGARLQVAQSSAVPDTFELIVELDGLEVPCQVVWRKLTEIGVSFLAEPTRVNPKRAQVIGNSGPTARSTLRRTPNPALRPLRPAEPARPVSSPAVSVATAEPVIEMPAEVVAPPAVPAVPPMAPANEGHQIPVLIAEDDPDDRLLMRYAFQEADFNYPIQFVEDGEELLRYVRGEAPYEARRLPGIILLDLNMPKMDGRTALMHLKTDSAFKRIPVIILTTSQAEEDIRRTYELGVTAYITKPNSQDGLKELVTALRDFWMRFVMLPPA